MVGRRNHRQEEADDIDGRRSAQQLPSLREEDKTRPASHGETLTQTLQTVQFPVKERGGAPRKAKATVTACAGTRDLAKTERRRPESRRPCLPARRSVRPVQTEPRCQEDGHLPARERLIGAVVP